jgi:HD-GYP domain-containing protein (c-di-GMP phosphodiesterase class II)
LEEFDLVKTHASAGYNSLRGETMVDPRISLIALQHHERPDGRGYPWQLAGTEIHPLARIVAVADVYDALTTDRVYRPAISVFEANKILQEGSGSQFDPSIVQLFSSVTVPFNIGSSVLLSNGVSGTVLRINSSNPWRPIVWTRQGTINLLLAEDLIIEAVI